MPASDSTVSGASNASIASDVLLVVGDGRLVTIELGDRDVVIGRGDGCDVALDHRSLSRRHAVLCLGPPATVRDLDSRNGTRIGTEVHRGGAAISLAAGEAFYIGPFSFVVVRRATRERSGSYS